VFIAINLKIIENLLWFILNKKRLEKQNY